MEQHIAQEYFQSFLDLFSVLLLGVLLNEQYKEGEEEMIKNCLICDKEINRSNVTTGTLRTKRHKDAVTCSRKCAKKYRRIREYIWDTYTNKRKGRKRGKNDNNS